MSADTNRGGRPRLRGCVTFGLGIDKSTEREIRTLIAAYVAGQIGFPDFNHAFSSASWARSEPGSLSAAAELLIAEYTSEHRTELTLRVELAALVSDCRVAQFGREASNGR